MPRRQIENRRSAGSVSGTAFGEVFEVLEGGRSGALEDVSGMAFKGFCLRCWKEAVWELWTMTLGRESESVRVRLEVLEVLYLVNFVS